MAERAQQITRIFHSAIAREPPERAPYLDGACGDDEALRHEVEALVKSHESAGSFIDSPAYEQGAQLLSTGRAEHKRAGQSIGPYKIISLVGAGGMGEVYRAHDSRLGRDVALKLLPHSLAIGPESVRRFQQEARAASALNHPNILAIHDIGEHEGSPYIVSELLEGETLRQKLSGGPLAARKALDYALQTARGLAAAHDKGIVHRDLKPENLFVTKDGRVKILDFGIAKLVQRNAMGGELHTEAPTLMVQTDSGMVIGTAGYMSPEQVRGQIVDTRSDIFSFGAILYEALSGQRAFHGASPVETMNAILKEEPAELSSTNTQISPTVERLVRRCLEKQPQERFQSASDLAFAIESLSGTQSSGATNAVAVATTSSPGVGRTLRDRLGWIAAAILLLSLITLAVFYFRRAAEPRADIIRFTLSAPEKSSYRGELALSPDGRRLAFVADGSSGRSLWVRALDSVEARELPGTADASLPFWSPDSRFIAFFANNKLKRIDPVSGEPQVLADISADARGGAWAPDGTIIFTPAYTTPLSKVSAEGGAVKPFTVLDQSQEQTSHRWPSFLPDGRHFLYFALSNKKELQGIYVGSLDSKEVKFLLRASSLGAYAPGSGTNFGHLLFMRDKSLMAQPFDARDLHLTGESTVVAEGVLNFPEEGGPTAYAAFSASANGRLSYIPGNVSLMQMGWFDRAGKPLGLVGSPGSLGEAAQSPDGQRIAVVRSELNQLPDIWLHDLARGTTTRFTFDPAAETSAVWSGDGSRIFFGSNYGGRTIFSLYQKISSGAGNDELLLKTDYSAYPDDWFSGKAGELLLYEIDSSNTKFDLWVLPLTGERKPYPFLQTQFNETHAQFSPDGRFVTYVSDDSGRAEVYVQSFPASGGKWQISTGGGDQPQWRRDGRELFYMAPDKKLMAVPIVPGDSFAPGSPIALFATHVPAGSLTGNRNHYLVALDGKRFLVNDLLDEGNTQPITIVLNWAAALKR
jgi:serine/threonine protein kinase/Tol biopolymer transport system component